MNISITFRHMDTSEAVKRYATEKLAKIQKFLRQPMTAKVTLSVDRLKHIAEARISSGGEHLEAKWSSEDMYASIDVVLGKLERQIRASKGAAQARRRGAESLRTTPASEAALAAPSPSAKEVKRPRRAAGKKAPAKKRASKSAS
jgi:putative sigma-54 modulation protein